MMVDPARFTAREKRMIGYAPKFAAVIQALETERFIKGVTQIGPSAYTATETGQGFGAAAYEAASLEGAGAWYVTSANKGLRWSMGDMTAGVIIPPDDLPILLQAQEIVRALIPAHERPMISWTIGGCARALINWALDKPQSFVGYAEQLVSPRGQSNFDEEDDFDDEQSYQYHDCQPGRYDRVTLWDVEAYYFSAICRAKCLRVEVRPDGLQWGRWIGSEAERWRDVLAAVQSIHLLRNSLWGVCLGSHTRKTAYTSGPPLMWRVPYAAQVRDDQWPEGKVRTIKPSFRGGPFRALGLLVSRSTSEACAIAAAEVGSIYSTVDSVTTTTDARPAYWQALGFNARIKAEGPADIVARGAWRIGTEHTRPYYKLRTNPPADYTCPVPLTPVERYSYSVNYHRLWLS